MDERPCFELRVLHTEYRHRTNWKWSHLQAPYWRLYWNVNRGGRIIHEGREIPLHPDSIYLVAPDTDYEIRSARRIDHLFIHFLVCRPFDKPQPGILELPMGPDGTMLARRLIAQCQQGEARAATDSAVRYALCAWALAQVPGAWFPEQCPDPVIAHVLEVMDANLHRAVSNVEFARSAHMGLSTFQRRFKAVEGESCQAVFRRKRVQRACLLLQFSEQPIEEIAAACGFADRHHFSKVFLQVRGMSPAHYRRLTLETASEDGEAARFTLRS